ncbi:MAG: hypothetical protein L3J93_04295 [Thermoplasmata archaeon]|nr:hypothetical protein [Thermoplasmata archaeon]
MNARARAATIATMLGMALLVLPSLAAPVGATPTTGPGAPQQWAYGAKVWENHSAVGQFGQYNSSAFFGWDVVINLTNTSATTVEIHGVRTVALHYDVRYCRPNCTSPNATATMSVRAWQQDSAYVNLTSTATVYVHGANNSSVAASALGLANASASGRGNLSESYKILRGTTTLASGRLLVARASHLTVDFSPALGLVPWNLSSGEIWNASSAFTALGGWNDSYSYLNTVHGVTSTGSGNASGAVSHAGQVDLRGADRGSYTLRNGRNVTVIVLAVSGPFELRDGFFLAPAGSDLFGGATSDWAVRAYGDAVVSTATLDVARDSAHGAPVVLAASAQYSAQATPLGASTVSSGTGVGTESAPPSSGAMVQAQPESVPVAQANAQCAVVGCSPSTVAPSSASSFGLALLVGGVAASALGIALVLRSRPKPPAKTAPSSPMVGTGPSS